MELSQLEANKQQYIEYFRYEKGLDRKTIKAYSTDTGQFIQFVSEGQKGCSREILQAYICIKVMETITCPVAWRFNNSVFIV